MTHGQFYTNGKESFLEYYEGVLKRQKLDDEFWEKVEEYFTKGYYILRQQLIDLKIIIKS